MDFEWNIRKEASNIKKHGMSFVAASKIFMVQRYEARYDRFNEARYLVIGDVENRVLVVVYTKRRNTYRIISARKANKNEEATYKKHCQI
jgi:uncharacterized protein